MRRRYWRRKKGRGFINLFAVIFASGPLLLATLAGALSAPAQFHYNASQPAAVASPLQQASAIVPFLETPPARGLPQPVTNSGTQYFSALSITGNSARAPTSAHAPTSPYATRADLTQLTQVLTAAIIAQSRGATTSAAADFTATAAYAALLHSIALTNAAVGNSSGNTFTSVTVNGVKGLAAADIPSLSASYLSTGGGTLTGLGIFAQGYISQASSTVLGNLTVTGALSGTTLSLANASTTLLSVGGPAYFGATATSTFGTDGSLTLAKALTVGSGGTGWTTINGGSILFGNGSSALATSTSLFWDNTNGRLGIGSTSPATNLSVGGNAYITGALGVGVLNTSNDTLSFADPGSSSSTLITLAGRQFLNASSSATVGNLYFGLDAGAATTNAFHNTAFGYQALQSATTSNDNTAFGYLALQADTAQGGVAQNTAVGSQALKSDTWGGENTAVGFGALSLEAVNSENTAVGWNALNASTGGGSVAVGNAALFTNTNGGSTAVGSDALKFYNNNQPSVAVGDNALKNWVAGGNNTAIGSSAMMNFVTNDGTANSNVAVGDSAMIGASNSAGSQVARNVAIGNNNLANLTSNGKDNTSVGNAAGQNISSGQLNIFLGSNAANGITTGSKNVFLGAQSASTTQTGSNNVALGYDVALPVTNGSNQLNIGNLLFATGINAEGTTVSNGNFGIGTTTPYSRLTVWGSDTAVGTAALTIANNASTTEFQVFDNGSAALAGTLTQNSDERLKTDIASLDASSTLAAIEALNPVTYQWLDPTEGSPTQIGFVAQQVQQIFPELVATTSPTALTPGGTLGLNYIGLIAPIVGAVKEIAGISGAFKDALVAWLGDAGNGVHDLYATVFHGQEADIQKLCVGSTCITQNQLDAILSQTGQAGSAGQGSVPAGASPTTSASTTPDTTSAATSSPATTSLDNSVPATTAPI